jgi:hypothetical protein
MAPLLLVAGLAGYRLPVGAKHSHGKLLIFVSLLANASPLQMVPALIAFRANASPLLDDVPQKPVEYLRWHSLMQSANSYRRRCVYA